jgi:hypothetical protein
VQTLERDDGRAAAARDRSDVAGIAADHFEPEPSLNVCVNHVECDRRR